MDKWSLKEEIGLKLNIGYNDILKFIFGLVIIRTKCSL